ncbi:MAG: hypothetical protein M3388_17085 [Acidobacteriota bacterium]|nr:hypothetical protein [Acidobacteriota bacterium]
MKEYPQNRTNKSTDLSELAAPPSVPTIPLPVTNLPQTNAEFGTRPEIWYCLFCGCPGGASANNKICPNCKAERPVFDDGITYSRFFHCG